jgi:tetratricopeptide (TPR) repeat protein
MRLPLLAAVLAMSALAGPLDESFTAEERALMAELDAERLIKARTLAEALLAKAPESFVGAWAMTRVHHDEEGNHARALAWVRRAQKLLGDRDVDWAKKLLLEEYYLLAEMDRNEDALAVLDRHAKLYGEPSAALRIWPLFKLGRNAESRAIALRLAASSDFEDRVDAYNGLLSIAFEEHDRHESYRWAMEAVAITQNQNCTILRNAAGTAFTMLRLDEAEELATRAKKTRFCIDPVDNMRASLALVMGQFQNVISALQSSRATRIEKRYRPHFAGGRRQVLVDLLDAVGKHGEAVTMAADLYRQQARIGVSSSPPAVERLARTFRYALALDGRITQLREQLSTAELPGGPAAIASELSALVARRWEVRRALLQIVSEPGRMVLLMRPNLGEVADSPSYRVSELMPVVGTGVMRAAIARARLADADTPAATPYFDALEGEVAFREGRLEEAVALAHRALEAFSPREAMWRWRTQTWRADALRRLGRSQEARADYQELLQRWPTGFRWYDLRIPAEVRDDGSAPAKETARRLRRSTRFDVTAGAPFQLAVESDGASVSICLRDDLGTLFSCATGEGATAALDAFHAAAFSPRISLTQSDLRSLDGSPVRVGADAALQKLLTP